MPRGLRRAHRSGHSPIQVEDLHALTSSLRGLHPAPRHPKETDMAWHKPQATDLRYGFEITMYISNR